MCDLGNEDGRYYGPKPDPLPITGADSRIMEEEENESAPVI